MDRESLYIALPPLLQNVILNLEGYLIQRRRYSTSYRQTEQLVEQLTAFQGQVLLDYQTARLRKILLAAAETSFWQRKFSDYDIDWGYGDPFFALRKLPILTKAEVKAAGCVLLNPKIAKSNLISRHTSGTTGSGLKFWETSQCERETWATWWRYRHWHGLTRSMWCGYFGGRSIVPVKQHRPPYWRFNYPGKQLMFSAYHLSADTAPAYLSVLKERGIGWLHGYPSTISLLASYAGKETNDIVQWISFGAESLSLTQRAIVQKAFPRAQLIQHYGQAEAVANISQCRYGRLHIDEDFSFVEFVQLPELPGKYRLVGTNWTNEAFPLLRYDTGDIVTLSDVNCPCGSKWRTVEDIDGRIEDFIELPNGARVGRLDHIFKDMVNIVEAQIHQSSRCKVTFLVVRGQDYSNADERQLLIETRKRLGEQLSVEIRYVDAIQRTHAGKLRFVLRQPETKDTI